MPALRILLPGLLATTLFAQTDQNAAPNPSALINSAIQGITRNSLVSSAPIFPSHPFQGPFWVGRASQCVVPLIEIVIPDGKNYVIGQVKPPKDFSDKMLTAPGLPACTTAPN